MTLLDLYVLSETILNIFIKWHLDVEINNRPEQNSSNALLTVFCFKTFKDKKNLFVTLRIEKYFKLAFRNHLKMFSHVVLMYYSFYSRIISSLYFLLRNTRNFMSEILVLACNARISVSPSESLKKRSVEICIVRKISNLNFHFTRHLHISDSTKKASTCEKKIFFLL